MFLLRYISEVELRQAIQVATNKSERFNEFVQWIAFGGDNVIAENIRDEQRKFIKYNHLVANILAFHNLVSMTKAIDLLKAQGQKISNEVLAALGPYQTSHINRLDSTNFIPAGHRNPCRLSASLRTSRRARWLCPVWLLVAVH